MFSWIQTCWDTLDTVKETKKGRKGLNYKVEDHHKQGFTDDNFVVYVLKVKAAIASCRIYSCVSFFSIFPQYNLAENFQNDWLMRVRWWDESFQKVFLSVILVAWFFKWSRTPLDNNVNWCKVVWCDFII